MNDIVLFTGLNGLVGSRINELLGGQYTFMDISRSSGVDITDGFTVEDVISNSPAKVVIHMAAKTNVDECEDDKLLGEEGDAWQVNVVGTENIIDVVKKTGKRLIYISTDFVFDGTKENYTETDEANPVNWYGYTKLRGEELIQESGIPASILRISYPYRANFSQKSDFVRTIIDRLHKKEHVTALTDHIFTPTFIDDIAVVLDEFIQHDLPGIYHVCGSEHLRVYDAAVEIAKTFGLETASIKETTREEFFKHRAFRPFKLALKNDKITKLGIKMHGFIQGLDEIKKQVQVTN